MKTVDLKNFNNDWYNPGNKVKILLWFIFGRIFLNTYLPIPVSLKLTILRLFGGGGQPSLPSLLKSVMNGKKGSIVLSILERKNLGNGKKKF